MADWQDRRGMFQKGKEKAAAPTTLSQAFGERRTSGAGIADAVRRASSSNTGLFGNLQQHKRGSEDYADRRTSHSEQGNAGGMFSGWYNSTFRGYQKSVAEAGGPAVTQQQENKKGVME